MGQPARVAQVTPKYNHKQPAKIVEGGEGNGSTTRLDNPQQWETSKHPMSTFVSSGMGGG
ncbi:hypothetical protein H113_03662 [Trichophyton rubrum MR1459]|uniref:Uncharacterized protein n=2 Tax=Trichophyton TaxID=5550 RepID=F2SQU4_TRIRC|nr:uncharacterized protein TERG_08843 [Trichophyton rubrum CBS 118892]EGD88712.2 hypothetical protein TERG_08843 [Trichophyton rubrum CBS 118892]EZF23733.1 hypothetical protein H100_03638 [Trichophyton rubrum MR850]EZF74681.1 hypothetical protein H105_03655 [Trichophyton soudanense CBS 452.61]EZF96125.1 hypothetical protein H113_03662 [Trichophyton rubrum MR1459]